MSIIRREDYQDPLCIVDLKGAKCFYCQKKLKPPFVHWAGGYGDLFLHAKCVVKLFFRMYRDADEIMEKRK